MPRLLVVLPQLPQDPGSGAARSVRTAAELLVAHSAGRWEARFLATTATEGRPLPEGPLAYLRAHGLDPQPDPAVGRRGTWTFRDHGLEHLLLDTGEADFLGWQTREGRHFDGLFDALLADWRPDLLYTYGGSPGDVARHARARAAGCRVAFALCNNGYLHAPFFEGMTAVLTQSQFMADLYRDRIGLASTTLSTPLDLAATLVPAGEHRPVFFTMVNPSREKGVFFLARLAEELGTRRPDLPLLVVESRAGAADLLAAGRAGGFDLARHANLMFSPAVPLPRDLFRPTRALLVPSVWNEPSARVAAEALINGIPPLVSDRGGVGENCRSAGFVLPLPEDLTMDTDVPVAPGAVAPWLAVMERLADDEAFYAEHCQRARAAGQHYRPEVQGPRYVEFFENALATGQ